jgi:hypothetical protein
MKKIFTLILMIAIAGMASAQISISNGTTVTQDFSIGALPTAATPPDWRVSKSTSARTVVAFSSSTSATEQVGGNGLSSSATNGIYNFGAGLPASATDRAIGFVSSSSSTKSGNVCVRLNNNGAESILSFTVSYNVEKYRNGTNAAGYMIQMYTSPDGSTWTSAGNDFLTSFAADANSDGFVSAPSSSTNVNKSINVTVTAGSDFFFAWNYSVVSGTTTSNAQALAIDDVSITANAALPISLLKFEATKLAEKVKISWATATEINNDKFIIERSADGENFERVTEVRGAGNSKELNAYEAVDANPLKGTSYYRLTQYDFNGEFETFAPVAVSMEHGGLRVEHVARSIQQGAESMELRVFSPLASNATILVRDLIGRSIYTEKLLLQEGYQNFNISTHNLGPGIYFVSLNSGTEVVLKKVKL